MIGIWMLYCASVGLLAAAAGHLLESGVRRAGLPARRVWLGAMLTAVLFPLLGVVLRGGDLPETARFPEDGAPAPVAAAWLVETVDELSVADGFLFDAWLGLSGLLVLLAVAATIPTLRARRAWVRREVDGTPVLLSEDIGPAVVGALRCRVVMPRWALAAPARDRALMLRHETEHVAAGDPRLLLLARCLLVVAPWNPALWYMARRLARAVEVDCDGRVLRSGVDPRTYGALLLRVGARRPRAAFAAPALARSRSLLEHRIVWMTERRRGALGALVPTAAAALVLGLAWMVPQPVRATDATGWFLRCTLVDPGASSVGSHAPAEPQGPPQGG